MQDPSHGVPQQLLQHVHLISSYRYPYMAASLSPDQILEFLVQAPKIVREAAAMAWTYLNAPQNGTVFLAWQPTSQLGTEFATDGYIWAGPEKVFRNERRGYNMEIFVNESGFDPKVDQMAVHRRVRYRIVGNQSGHHIDPLLEIVHYTAALPESRLPSRSIPITPVVNRQMQERRYLESQGSLVRKEFMLNDRNNWPHIGIPGGQLPAQYAQQNSMYNRAGIQGFGNARGPGIPANFSNQAMGRPPYGIGPTQGRRPNQPQPPRMPGASPGRFGMPHQQYDALQDDEENPASGDLLDTLTPKDISTTRYTQHHEWMDEIFSTPYSINQIRPMALGLGLPGELSELTRGILLDPSKESVLVSPQYQSLEKVQVEEIERRVSTFLKRGEEQLAEMKKEHAKRMEEMSGGNRFAELEKNLAIAADQPDNDETLQQIEEEAEKLTASKIGRRDEIVRVQLGGLIQEEDKPTEGVGSTSTNMLQDEAGWSQEAKTAEFDSMTFANLDGAPSMSDEPPEVMPETVSQSGHRQDTRNATESAAPVAVPADAVRIDETQAVVQAGEGRDTAAEAAEMDVDIAETAADKEAVSGSEGDATDPKDWIMVNPDDEEGAGESIEQQPNDDASNNADDVQAGTSPGMFDEASQFGEFANLDTAGEALASYGDQDDGDLGLDLDNSAFGDAFASHEEQEPSGT